MNADSDNQNPAPSNSTQQSSQPANPQSTPPASDTTPHASATNLGMGGARLIETSFQETGKPQEAVPANQQGNQKPTGDQTNNGTPLNITMTPTNGDNGALQAQIENALRNEPSLSSSHVAVNVTDSAVELSGTVGSSKDKVAAERIAQSFGTNRKLNDKLMVTGHGHSDMAQDHPAMNNSGTGNTGNQAPH
jgi:hypothetical protein